MHENSRSEISTVLDVSGNLEHVCSKRHFVYILSLVFFRLLKAAGSLGFHWAATFVESGLGAFIEKAPGSPVSR